MIKIFCLEFFEKSRRWYVGIRESPAFPWAIAGNGTIPMYDRIKNKRISLIRAVTCLAVMKYVFFIGYGMLFCIRIDGVKKVLQQERGYERRKIDVNLI
jgi:hypothetical protein